MCVRGGGRMCVCVCVCLFVFVWVEHTGYIDNGECVNCDEGLVVVGRLLVLCVFMCVQRM